MAAVYQAGLQTLFSISELKQLSYNDVKTKIGEVIGLDASDSVKAVDISLLENFYANVCEQPVTTTASTTTTVTAAGTTTTTTPAAGTTTTTTPAASSSGGQTPTGFVYTELGTGQRYNFGSTMSGSYTTGQDCCDLCAAASTNNKWVSWAMSGTPECRCKSSPSPPNEPGLKSGSSGFGRGSCLLPIDMVYTETGTGKRYSSGSSVSGSYTTGQECCDLCYNNNDNVKWISWIKPGSSSPSECRCYSCLLYTSPSPRDKRQSRMPSSA